MFSKITFPCMEGKRKEKGKETREETKGIKFP
jgi:hypothetical protein